MPGRRRRRVCSGRRRPLARRAAAAPHAEEKKAGPRLDEARVSKRAPVLSLSLSRPSLLLSARRRLQSAMGCGCVIAGVLRGVSCPGVRNGRGGKWAALGPLHRCCFAHSLLRLALFCLSSFPSSFHHGRHGPPRPLCPGRRLRRRCGLRVRRRSGGSILPFSSFSLFLSFSG